MKAFIQEFIKTHKVIEQLEASFQLNMDNYKKEHPEEFVAVFDVCDPNLLKTWVSNVAYKVRNWPEMDYESVEATLIIEYDGEYIGYYLLQFDLEGNITDDIFWGQ